MERLTTAVVQVQALATNSITPEDQPPTATTTAQTEHQTATATTCTTTAPDMDSKTTAETDTSETQQLRPSHNQRTHQWKRTKAC